jgi:hypothetical protein
LALMLSPARRGSARFVRPRKTDWIEIRGTEALSPFIGPRIFAEAQDVLRAA